MQPNKRPLSTAWTQHLSDPKAKVDFETIVRNSTQLLTRLKEIYQDRERQINNTSFTVRDFEDPNWSHKQAFKNGQLAMLKELVEHIPF